MSKQWRELHEDIPEALPDVGKEYMEQVDAVYAEMEQDSVSGSGWEFGHLDFQARLMTPAEQAEFQREMLADLGTLDDQPISAEENDDSLPSF